MIKRRRKHPGEENIIPGLSRVMLSHTLQHTLTLNPVLPPPLLSLPLSVVHTLLSYFLFFVFFYTIQREKLRRPGRECSVLRDAQGVKSERGN